MLGFEAGLNPPRIPIGVSWSLLFCTVYAGDESLVAETITTVEMNLGLRGRVRVADTLRAAAITGGGTLMRSSVPLPPDDDRMHIGPYAGGALEFVVGKYLISVEGRYGLLVGGPPSATLLVSASVGSN